MNTIAADLVERIGIALIHSLWQGSLVGIGLLIALVALRHARSQVRYLVCCLALVVTLLLPIATFLAVPTDSRAENGKLASERGTHDSAIVVSAAAALEAAVSLLPGESPGRTVDQVNSDTGNVDDVTMPQSDDEPQTAVRHEPPWLSPHAKQLLMVIVGAWSVGVVALSCRLLGGYVIACRLTRRLVAPVDDAWQVRVRQLAARLGMHRSVELWQTACVEVPVVLGCFRPVILVPVGMLTGLSVAQAEAILAHELAHVCRYDFLVNAAQCVIETLLFYHPCVWWISARIRAEREHCCDELAVAACGDARVLARALTGVEEMRPPARLAVALTSGGSLLLRIRRIVGQPRASDVVGGWLAGTLAIALPLAVGGTWAWGRAVNEQGPPVAGQAKAAATPGRQSASENEVLAGDAAGVALDSPEAMWPAPDERFAAPRVDFLVPPRPSFPRQPDHPLWHMLEENGPERTVKVVVTGLPGDVYLYIYEHLRLLMPNLAYFGTGSGDIATVYLAPISDLDYFAALIDLGEVTSIDRETRVITVVADRARLPRPKARATGEQPDDALGRGRSTDLPSLCERLVAGDQTAIDDLIALGSTSESAIAPYVGHDDRRVRRASLLVLKKVATAESLPSLLSGLSDNDVGNRDLAWQTICRVPGLAERREVIEAAAASLEKNPEQAVQWLISSGPSVERVVWPYLQSQDDRVRLRVLDVLKRVGTAESLPAIDALSKDAVDEIVAAAKSAREAIAIRMGRATLRLRQHPSVNV
jgi:beta-lactamase regulating signal transducer with metallopeptidase domain